MMGYRDYIPTLIVFVGFLATLGIYAALRLNGSEPGVLDELLLLEGGAVAGLAAPTVRMTGGVGK
jgi:hypothetical protein